MILLLDIDPIVAMIMPIGDREEERTICRFGFVFFDALHLQMTSFRFLGQMAIFNEIV